MPYYMNGKEEWPYESWDSFDDVKFYAELAACEEIPTTAGLSPEKYRSYIEPEFAAGNDILYVHFSAKMSSTFQALDLCLEMLKEKYPDRKFYRLDTKAMTIFTLPFLKEIGQKYKEGLSAEELIAYGESIRGNYACYFFADNLRFFAKSGRVSGFTAFVGGLFGIKPIIGFDNDGVMKAFGRENGKLNAIKRIMRYVEELGDEPEKGTFYIAHCGVPELAAKLRDRLMERYGPDIDYVMLPPNPTIGCHCGPGCVGVCFHAKRRV